MYNDDKLLGLFMTNLVTVLVSIVNIVLRTINMKLIDTVGIDTQSQKTSLIMKSIFITSFINTGIILLFTNANLEFSILKFVPIKNQYTDYTQNWYYDIAPSLCQTMIIMAVFPYIEIVMNGSIKKLLQRRDNGGSNDLITKKVTLQQYINLYSGPVYLMHFKYSTCMVQVFVAFMYGMNIPLLFPIAMFGIFNLYIVERWALAYYYRQPPMYDQALNNDVLSILKWAPVFMFLFGYWSIGNRQMFFNDPSVLDNYSSKPDPNHKLFNTAKIDQTHFVFLILLVIILCHIFSEPIFKLFRFCRLVRSVKTN
jgi:hypothetical protein